MLRWMLPQEAVRITVRVSGAEVDEPKLQIDGRRAPDGSSTGAPHLIVRPGLGPAFARLGNGVETPHFLARDGVEGANPSSPAAVAARDRHKQHAPGIGRRRCNVRRSSVGWIRRQPVRPHALPGLCIDGSD